MPFSLRAPATSQAETGEAEEKAEEGAIDAVSGKEAKVMHVDMEEKYVDEINKEAVGETLLTGAGKGVCERGMPTRRRATPSWVQSHPFGTVLPRMLQF